MKQLCSKIMAWMAERLDGASGCVNYLLANALTVTADEGVADEIKTLLADDQYADVHECLWAALRKLSGR